MNKIAYLEGYMSKLASKLDLIGMRKITTLPTDEFMKVTGMAEKDMVKYLEKIKDPGIKVNIAKPTKMRQPDMFRDNLPRDGRWG